jgi:glycosidase
MEIERIEPAFWWVGMKNPQLQIMVHGKNIAQSAVQVDYPGIRLQEVVRTGNPNYLFLYLEISEQTQAGTFSIVFTEGKKKLAKTYELKERIKSLEAKGFDSSDVLYLIMPDRFANGDTSNDVWDGEWVDRNDSYGRHGGDFAGIRSHLDYLNDLGITAVWLNPVLENKMYQAGYQSYHGYAITDFYKVDPRFGSNEDYCKLIDEIHAKGMKIVMDMVYNHCGSLHWWMSDLPCKDWLNHQEKHVLTTGNMHPVFDVHAPQSEINGFVKGWFVESMPDLNQQNPHLAQYLIQNCIWWIEYAQIDGIRHDTHPFVDFDFLSQWCKAVNDEYPDFNIVGESWYLNPAFLAWWQKNSKNNNRQTNLKTVMDFALFDAIQQAFLVDQGKGFKLQRIYETLAQDFLYSDLDNILVFLDNHDTSRFFKKEESDLNRYKQALALLLTTRGIPQLYYGTEILMSGEKREGDGNLRKDFPGGWPDDPANAFTPSGRSVLQNEAWTYLQTLLQWRKQNPAVVGGKLIHYAPGNSEGCYVYARIKDDARVLVILNGTDSEQSLSPDKYREVIGNAISGKEIISKQTIYLDDNISVPAKGIYIIEL